MIGNKEECLVCKTTLGLQRHHIFFGTANRKNSEKYDMVCMLCREHHTGNTGVHFNKSLDTKLKQIAQTKFEKEYSHDLFMKVFGRNYL